jgi:chromatin segregation and condensation protein Rec8/ScpA/Scc1 (kleisin family)
VLFRLIRQSLDQDECDATEYIQSNLPASLEGMLEEMKKKTGEPDPLEERLLEDLFRAVVKIRRMALVENINEVRFLQEDAQQTGDLRLAALREMVHQYSLQLRSLDQAQWKQNSVR